MFVNGNIQGHYPPDYIDDELLPMTVRPVSPERQPDIKDTAMVFDADDVLMALFKREVDVIKTSAAERHARTHRTDMSG